MRYDEGIALPGMLPLASLRVARDHERSYVVVAVDALAGAYLAHPFRAPFDGFVIIPAVDVSLTEHTRPTDHPDCPLCLDAWPVRHDASDRCESGKHPHCTCDTCF